MTYSPTEIAEILCTRLSHDLGGSIGAVSSVLELVRENNNVMDEETSGLMSIAAETMKSRQQFFRIAFGLSGKTLGEDEIRTLCLNYLETVGSRSTPLELELRGSTSKLAKITCLCVMTMAEVTVRGGKITVEINQHNIKMNVSSPSKLAIQKVEDYKKIINNMEITDNLPQYISLIYLTEILGKGAKFELKNTENELTLIIA